MSHIYSPIKSIHDLEICAWPKGKTFSPECVARYGDVTVMKLKNSHHIYCDAIKDHISYSPAHWRFTDGLMRCLVNMKIITIAQMNEHIADVKKYDEDRSKKYSLEGMIRLAEKYGFEITGEQWSALGGLTCEVCNEVILPDEKTVKDQYGEIVHEQCQNISVADAKKFKLSMKKGNPL